ncbi:PEPxxWA-CTERM sorting domain-containing protein [Sphingomonas sp. BIUV-7]|uniref:PEPxxWA-CTERM sorting domain-containing protein n=1 Tax=Sphingomonas natans TaxID=3063330 RepID=A0ABT8YC47_9SPHN|nr:PEPxxWA-CTERM sorting domain-containing protein [Sphingomonas sp. BIUV-7]MDO6415908.1 PEPxxWA-CTERM sorting domain-containing protein [Sphingomonas sp. BIUV-7]
MKKFRGLSYAVVSAAAFVAASSAQATIIDKTLTLTAGAFTSTNGTAAPISPVTIQFAITFDNSANIQGTTNGLTILSSNLTGWGPLKYAYDASLDNLFFGTDIGPNGFQVFFSRNDLGTFIRNISSATPVATQVQYSAAAGASYLSGTSSVTVAQAAVPEPATWAMFIGGFGLLGATMRRRKIAVHFA